MITMTITGETPEEIFSTIKGCAVMLRDEVPTATPEKPTSANAPAAASAPAPDYTVPSVPVNPTPVPVVTPANGVSQAAPSTSAAPTPVPTSLPPAGQTAPAPVPQQAPVTPAPTYTIEQVAKAGADLARDNPGMMGPLMALLQRYGVQTVTDLRPEQLGAFATELRGLGAKI